MNCFQKKEKSIFHLFLYHSLISKYQLLLVHYFLFSSIFIMNIFNKWEFQQIVLNHSYDINFKNFMKFYKKYSKESYSFLVNDTTLSSGNPLKEKIILK